MKLPILAITMGDINGIGPEILAKALRHSVVRERCHPLILGSTRAYDHARRVVGAPPPIAIKNAAEADFSSEAVPVLEGTVAAPPVSMGTLDPEAGRCAIEWVRLAIELAMGDAIDAIVTCPINKEGMHRAGYDFPGHTELLAQATGTDEYRLALISKTLRIIHNSTHCSLREAIELANQNRIATTIRMANQGLGLLALPTRRIAVCGLNPHAGEAGAFGSEEIEEIGPAIATCRAESIDCTGPFPADTILNRMVAGEFDMIVAMYHDQGHAPMKLVAMDEGVNVTFGVPVIRTSVDHGTAYDIAGKGLARESSLLAAIELAVQFALARERGA